MPWTRRDFLKTTMVSFASTTPSFLIRTATAGAAGRNDHNTVLVVVQLSGGNDGLNTVVPYADDEYARNRPTLRLSPKEVHKIDSYLGFHPRMEAFCRLYKEGRLSILHGVGYPNSDRSHDVAMRHWHTAEPENPDCQTGWLGRTLDSTWHGNERDDGRGTMDGAVAIARPPSSIVPRSSSAVFVGPITQPFALRAERVIVPSIQSPADLTLEGRQPQVQRSPEPTEWAGAGSYAPSPKPAALGLPPGEDNELLRFVAECTAQARTNSKRIKAATKSADGAEYPAFKLAETLRTVAQLIRADVGIRIFFAEIGGGGIGGFDNHANQLGNHCALLHQLSESLAAFIDDLAKDKLLDRVLLMTISEFGRTVQENGRRGTGHGAAAPVLLAGGKLKGGRAGSHPSLTDLDNGGLKHHTDFRRVYATVLDQWLGFDSLLVLGKQYQPLGVLNT